MCVLVNGRRDISASRRLQLLCLDVLSLQLKVLYSACIHRYADETAAGGSAGDYPNDAC